MHFNIEKTVHTSKCTRVLRVCTECSSDIYLEQSESSHPAGSALLVLGTHHLQLLQFSPALTGLSIKQDIYCQIKALKLKRTSMHCTRWGMGSYLKGKIIDFEIVPSILPLFSMSPIPFILGMTTLTVVLLTLMQNWKSVGALCIFLPVVTVKILLSSKSDSNCRCLGS